MGPKHKEFISNIYGGVFLQRAGLVLTICLLENKFNGTPIYQDVNLRRGEFDLTVHCFPIFSYVYETGQIC